MKKMLITAACLALVSCNKSEAPPATEEAAAPTAEAPDAGAPTGEIAGVYEVKTADGMIVVETIHADGSYVDMTNDKETDRGKWRADGDKTCFDPDGDRPETCFTTTPPGPDGSFKVIGPDGKETGSTVRKVSALTSTDAM